MIKITYQVLVMHYNIFFPSSGDGGERRRIKPTESMLRDRYQLILLSNKNRKSIKRMYLTLLCLMVSKKKRNSWKNISYGKILLLF